MQADDMKLVREYAIHHSELAFAELVARYLNFVYSSALRRVGDSQLAEEITQVVFILLARKAGELGDGTILPSWLYRATRCTASDALKHQWRRRQREGSYMEFMNQSRIDSDDAAAEEAWPRIAPLLEAALDKIG